MNALALARLDDPLAGSKHALRRSGFPRILASGVYASQPANDVGEKSSSYDELASGSLFWTQKDPIRFHGHSWNLYVYAGDDPINGSDPKGLTTYTCYLFGQGSSGGLSSAPIFHVYTCVAPPIGPPYCYGWGQTSWDYLNEPGALCYPNDNQSDCIDACYSWEQQNNRPSSYNPITSSCLTWSWDVEQICNQACGFGSLN
jgi:hypothetical protein